MRTFRALVVGFVVAAGTVVGLVSPAAACSCAGPPFEANEEFGNPGIEGYDAVFVGTVVGSSPAGEQTEWQFEIDYIVRGQLATPITVVTPSDGGACGFENLFEGDERAVGLRERAGQWESGLCSIDMPEAVAHISFRAEPSIAVDVPDESDGVATNGGLGLGLVALGFAAVLAAVAGAVVLSRRPKIT